ncbi:acyltransferase [Tenacibaculum sp. SSH1-16]|uniref:acyltransferase family protein n=1 Tax=Tenacibaculum sp. SSH1-16 TaxID=3136667 RepID=UPI0032C4581A|nr:acyltransferase [Tenacibaculum mesophilum]
MENNRILILDDLRGLAILTVAFYHYFFVYYLDKDTSHQFLNGYKFFNDYLNLGSFGVSLFFITSGFVIALSLKGEGNIYSVINFAIKRFFRLYPTYWFAIIFIVSSIYLLKGENNFSLRQISINFTMFQDLLKVKHIDGVFWTLAVELKFYFIAAILFYFNLLKRIKAIVIIFFIISIITLCLGYLKLYNTYFGNGLWTNLMLMFLGTALFFHYKKQLKDKDLKILVVLVFLYFSFNFYFLPYTEHGGNLGYSVAKLLAISVFIISLKYKNKTYRFTRFLGKVSYSFYLIHQVVGFAIISVLIPYIAMPFSQIITFIVLVYISLPINKFIEIPSNNLGRKIISKKYKRYEISKG